MALNYFCQTCMFVLEKFVQVDLHFRQNTPCVPVVFRKYRKRPEKNRTVLSFYR